MKTANWPAAHVRRGFRRLYLVIVVPWVLVLAFLFAIITRDYLENNTELKRLSTEIDATFAHDPNLRNLPANAPAAVEVVSTLDNLDAVRLRQDAVEQEMVRISACALAPPLLILLLWRAFIWIGSGFQRNLPNSS